MRRTLPLLALVGACGAAQVPPPNPPPPPPPSQVAVSPRPFARSEADLVGRTPSAGALVFARPGRGAIVDLDVAPDGSFVVVSTDDGTVTLVDARTGETRGHRRVAIRGERYLDVQVDASSSFVAVRGLEDGAGAHVEVWDLVSDTWSSREVAEQPGEARDRRGERLLEPRSDGSVAVLDAHDRRALVHLRAPSPEARMRATFGSDGSCILTQAALDTVELHRASDGERVATIDAGMPSDALDAIDECRSAFLPRADGSFVHVRAEDGAPSAATERPGEAHAVEATEREASFGERLAVAADGSRAAVAVRDVLHVHDLRTGERVQVSPGTGERSVWGLGYAPSGDRLFVTGRGFVVEVSAAGVRALPCDGPASFDRLPNGTPFMRRSDEACFADHRFRTDASDVFLAVAPDGRAAIFARGAAFVERDATGENTLVTFPADGCDPYAGCRDVAAFSPDGRYAVVQRGRAIRIVDRRRHRVVRTADAEEDVAASTFSADGRSLVLPSSAGYMRVDLATGRASRLAARLGATFLPEGPIARFVFARERGARGDGVLLVVEATRGRVVRRFAGASGPATITGTFTATRFGIRARAALWYDAAEDVAIALPADATVVGADHGGSLLALCEGGRLVVRRVGAAGLGSARDVASCDGVGAVALRDDGHGLALSRGTAVELFDLEGAEPPLIVRALPTDPAVPAFAATTDGRFELSPGAEAAVRARGPGPVWSAPLVPAADAPGRTEGLLGGHLRPVPTAAETLDRPTDAHASGPDARTERP